MLKFLTNWWCKVDPPLPEAKFQIRSKVITPFGDQIMAIRTIWRNCYEPTRYDCAWFDKFGKYNEKTFCEDELILYNESISSS